MASDCLAGCIADYKCGVLNVPGPAGEQGENFAPWVKVQILAGQTITVGNESYSADPNSAVVKSFEVGWFDTPQCMIEIVDEAGGRMGAVVNTIHKCATSAGQGTTIKFQFGWIITDCYNRKKKIASQTFESKVASIEVSYSEGKIKYKITGTHGGTVTDHMREDYLFGEDDKKISLEDAIRQLYSKPPEMGVRFVEKQKDGKIKDVELNWKGFPKGGPRSVWQADNQARDAVVRKWIDPFRIDDGTVWGKGLILDDSKDDPNLKLIIVDVTPNPGELQNCERGFGTYIVNGGKCSPVIEFSPTFNWLSGFANFSAGGGTNGPGGTASTFAEDQKIEEAEKSHGPSAGFQTQTGMTQQAWDAYGPKNAYPESMRSQQAHLKGSVKGGIQAELRILGDPREPFTGPLPSQGSPISIVAINPFYIQQNSNRGCGDWLAVPGCNEVLSNKNWMVMGINHSIKEGSYTTTLKLLLGTPGINAGKDDPAGGQGSGGAKVKNTC